MNLTYKASSAELNELHLTFNEVAKTIIIASINFKEGEETKALINYNEAYYIFKAFKIVSQMNVCTSNSGALHMQMNEYKWAAVAYAKAAESMEPEASVDDKEDGTTFQSIV